MERNWVQASETEAIHLGAKKVSEEGLVWSRSLIEYSIGNVFISASSRGFSYRLVCVWEPRSKESRLFPSMRDALEHACNEMRGIMQTLSKYLESIESGLGINRGEV